MQDAITYVFPIHIIDNIRSLFVKKRVTGP